MTRGKLELEIRSFLKLRGWMTIGTHKFCVPQKLIHDFVDFVKGKENEIRQAGALEEKE